MRTGGDEFSVLVMCSSNGGFRLPFRIKAGATSSNLSRLIPALAQQHRRDLAKRNSDLCTEERLFLPPGEIQFGQSHHPIFFRHCVSSEPNHGGNSQRRKGSQILVEPRAVHRRAAGVAEFPGLAAQSESI